MAKSKVGIVALAIMLGPKLGLIGLKLLKSLKAGKLIFAAASLAAYSYMFTWQFAFLILFMLFVHESGHIWAMKKCGMKTKGIYFIPFLGAAAVPDEEFKSRNDESYIAIMGPIWGLALSMLAMIAYGVTDQPFFAATASWIALINLFNLMPINPLDGGRIVKSIAFSFHSRAGIAFLILGLLAAAYIALVYRVGLCFFLIFVGVFDLAFELWGKKAREKDRVKHAKRVKDLDEKRFRTLREMGVTTEAEFFCKAERSVSSLGATPQQAEMMRELHQEFWGHVIEARKRRDAPVQIQADPSMNMREMATAIGIYFSVVALLLCVMFFMNHVPGAAAAMGVLKDSN